MTPIAALAIWSVELVVIAALASSPRGARLGFVIALVALAVPTLVVASPVGLALFALAFMWCVVRAADLAFDPAPADFAHRLLHLVAVLDTRLLVRGEVRVDRAALLRLVVAAALAWGALAALMAAPTDPAWLHYAVRWTAGAVFTLAVLEAFAATLEFAAAALGWITPPLHDMPHLARSIAEFWGRRWNRIVSSVLHARAFAPLSRRSTTLAIVAAFALSAAMHAYLIGIATGLGAALAWAAFFLLQPLGILAERRLGVRRWAPWAGHAWTITVIGLLSPLMVEPALRALRV